MQTSGVTAQHSITDLAASIAFGAATPGMTVGFRHNDFHRCVRTGAQAFDRKLADHPAPTLACQWQGAELHLHVGRPAIDVAADALRCASSRLLEDVSHMDRGKRGFPVSEHQGTALYFGQVR